MQGQYSPTSDSSIGAISGGENPLSKYSLGQLVIFFLVLICACLSSSAVVRAVF